MKLFFTGTDSLMLVDYSMRRFWKKPYWWLFRRLVRIIDFFVEGYICETENISDNLRRFGLKKNITIMLDQLKHTEVFPKEPHSAFNVLFYHPLGGDGEFKRWLYGFDIFKEVKDALAGKGVQFIIIYGENDMRYVYPYVDFYLRPNRHDGASRLRRECEIQGIPYYWTQKDPSVEDAVKAIEDGIRNNNI